MGRGSGFREELMGGFVDECAPDVGFGIFRVEEIGNLIAGDIEAERDADIDRHLGLASFQVFLAGSVIVNAMGFENDRGSISSVLELPELFGRSE